MRVSGCESYKDKRTIINDKIRYLLWSQISALMLNATIRKGDNFKNIV